MNDDSSALLLRIAEALERLAPPPVVPADPLLHPAYRWDGTALCVVNGFRPLPVALLNGIDRQKAELATVLARHADGLPSHDVLLWGARGTGKSVLVKALIASLQNEGKPIALIECAAHAVRSMPALFARLAPASRRFVIFIDDIAFDSANEDARHIRSMLDGGAEARPPHIRLIVTSNRRNIVARNQSEQDAAINPRDVEEDTLALADRFGLKLGFQRVDQSAYLAMVAGYADHFGLTYDPDDALQFAHQRGGQSGRTAWHYVVECAGKEGKSLTY